MRETPRRMAQAYVEMLSVEPFDFTTFENSEGYDELVLVQDIPVRSVCEHHMLPLRRGRPRGVPPRRPDPRAVEAGPRRRALRRRTQTQERLTKQVAEHLQTQLEPRGVGVVIEAEHTCMSLRGVRAVGARTVTSTLFGTLREDAASRAEFLALTRDRSK